MIFGMPPPASHTEISQFGCIRPSTTTDGVSFHLVRETVARISLAAARDHGIDGDQ